MILSLRQSYFTS